VIVNPVGRSRTAVVVCLLAALTLMIADIRGSALGGQLRSVVASISGPAQRVFLGIQPAQGAGAGSERQSMSQLIAENEALRGRLAAAARGELDRAAATELAAIAPPAGYRQVRARVIAVAAPSDLVAAVTLDSGSRDGVVAGAAVISSAGLVGVVDSVSPATATVRLLTDVASTIGARVARTKEVGLFHGQGQADRGTLELLDPLGAMRSGDLVVTLGSRDGLPFPRGLPIGQIAAVTGTAAAVSRRAVIATTVDASTLDEVAILVGAGRGESGSETAATAKAPGATG
jgi:rod shape-determining protein MreC